jgi:hypothetical protein
VVDKEHIIREIQRTAKANGGVALGWRRFEIETSIGSYAWGRFWSRWNDAVREAGFEPNRMTQPYGDEHLLEKLIVITRELGRIPVHGDLRFASLNDPTFPNEKSFGRLGTRAQRAARVVALCEGRADCVDVAAIWRHAVLRPDPEAVPEQDLLSVGRTVGYVYLFKHGARREYKIGRTNNALLREGELGIQLPEKVQPVHYIKTDDPSGIESYWHTRFAKKRKEGEWFALTPEDVLAFKRWRRIY